MLYYAAMATLGLGRRLLRDLLPGGEGREAFLRKRLQARHVERALAAYKRNGLLALMIPALLRRRRPSSCSCSLAGVAGVRPVQFVVALAIRGALPGAGHSGDLRRRGARVDAHAWAIVALVVVGVLVVAAVGWWLMRRRRDPEHDARALAS